MFQPLQQLPITLENMTVCAAGNGSAITLSNSSGTITIKGNVRLEGFGQRIKVGCPITINANSSLYVEKGVSLTNVASITMADQTSVLHLDGCSLYTGNGTDGTSLTAGLSLTKGTLMLDNKVQILNKNYGGASNTSMSKGFLLGDGTASNDANVVVLAGAYVTVDGCMKYNHS